jgi:site-specific recombinase XerD
LSKGLFSLATITEAISVFILDREAQNLASKTLTTYRKRLTKFMDWCEDRSITTVGDLTMTNVRLYQVHLVKTMADVSAKNHMVDVKTFLKFCVEQQIISESPAAKLKLPRVVERLPKVLTPNQVRRLYTACETDRERAALLVLVDTGCRAAEFCSINTGSIDFNTGTITILAGKPRRDRRCYICSKTQAALRAYIHSENIQRGALWRPERGNGRLTESGLAQMLRRLGDRADVHVTPHMIRKTFVTSLLRTGVDVFTLMKLSGHRDTESLKPYIQLADEDARAAHKQHSPVAALFK